MKLLVPKRRLIGMEIVPIEQLYPSIKYAIHPDNYKNIKDNIEKNGLKWPIMCWRTTAHKWAEWCKDQEPIFSPPEEVWNKLHVLVVMCGNNRLQAAKELGYDHIDVNVNTDKAEISKWCGKMRKDWRKECSK